MDFPLFDRLILKADIGFGMPFEFIFVPNENETVYRRFSSDANYGIFCRK